MCVCSISPRISSPANLPSGVAIETLDLMRACPIWDLVSPNHALMARMLGLRERWSYRTVMISGPRTILDADVKRARRDDWHVLLQLAAYKHCRSQAFWWAVGPPELLQDLLGNTVGKALPFIQGGDTKSYVASLPMSLLLCQHEIRGD